MKNKFCRHTLNPRLSMEHLVKNPQMFSMLFFACLAFMVVVQAQNQTDFISIDCGSPEKNYTDGETGINYVTDEGFTDEGISMNISADNEQTFSNRQQLLNVRSFPNGTKNCYNLRPSKGKGRYYLIRAMFMYGNYDNLSSSPNFDLYMDVNFWDTVKFDAETEIFTKELIYFPLSDYINVCLVNKGNGTPFISVLELRLMNSQSYSPDSGSLELYSRLNFNSNVTRIRYSATDPGGDYSDRIWYASNSMSWNNISADNNVDQGASFNSFEVASSVMKTAITPANDSGQMGLFWISTNNTYEYYVYMHFAEIQTLGSNQSREFDIFLNGIAWFRSFSPSYLSTSTVYSPRGLGSFNRYEFWLNKTANSTHPPLINAIEIYREVHFQDLQTDQNDVDAIMNIKSVYRLRRNWIADPCAPKAFIWEGLLCNYSGLNSDSSIPRIVSLNLSSSGLNGEIAPAIASLIELQYLDLSNNSLQGSFPAFLSNLPLLKVINLERNNLSGSIPPVLLERSKNGSLSLYLDHNPLLSTSEYNSTEPKNNKNEVVIPVVASVGGLIFLSLLATAAVIWRFKRRNGTKKDDEKPANQFTYSEILSITNNFEKVLGKGGFGTVYFGSLKGNTVAVKVLSPSAVHGYPQFHAEAQFLTEVHHKNLTSLIGYSDDGTNKSMIYDFMYNGDLSAHLFDAGKDAHVLTWEKRLEITLNAAHGLEYLHHGCKPPIIHRDIKSTNILLNERFEASLSDYGLSRIFPNEGSTYESTVVAGTPGYFDPEYIVSRRLNEKSDVYSFGVVILEIITGRPAISRGEDKGHVSQWVSSMVAKGDVKSIVDPKLEGSFDASSVWKATEVAMACVCPSSVRRPTMSHVVSELEQSLAMARRNGRESEPRSQSETTPFSVLVEQLPSPHPR